MSVEAHLGALQNPSYRPLWEPSASAAAVSLCTPLRNRVQASRACPDPPRPRHPEGGDFDDDAVTQATLRWVRSTVIGLNLCPWAGGALVGGRMRVIAHPPQPLPIPAGAAAAVTSDAVSDIRARGSSGGGHSGEGDRLLESLVEVAAQEAMTLGGLEGEAAVNATTLVVARPPAAEDFEEFLEVVGAVDDFLENSGLRGTVQVGRGPTGIYLSVGFGCRFCWLFLSDAGVSGSAGVTYFRDRRSIARRGRSVGSLVHTYTF